MLIIYSQHSNSPRFSYIVSHIFEHILGVEWAATDNKDFYLSQPATHCINYSEEDLGHGIQILPQGLLFEQGVREMQTPDVSTWQGFFILFPQTKGDIPFDIFSASFYLLSSYEEYFPQRVDIHRRFRHEESLLYRNKTLEIPVVDRWSYLLKDELLKTGCEASVFHLRKFRMVSTFDIDHPYLYLNKGLIKTVGGFLKDVLCLRYSQWIERWAVNLNMKHDPYFQALLLIEEVHKQLDRPYSLFILMNDEGEYGRKLKISPVKYYDYLNCLKNVNIGLHPSYDTLRNLGQLQKEKQELEQTTGRKMLTTRQHFLRMQIPETFQELVLAGFEEDFTLIFPQAPGFRSGTAIPYYFYDLSNEKTTSLCIHPTAMMDTTLMHHLKYSPEQGLEKMKYLIDQCKLSGGDYVSLWHNSNLSGNKKSKPWISVFVESLKYGISHEND